MAARYTQLAIKLKDLDFLGPLNRCLRTKDANGTEHCKDWYVLAADATLLQQATHILGLQAALGDLNSYNMDNFFSMLTQLLPVFRAQVFCERRETLPEPLYGNPNEASRPIWQGALPQRSTRTILLRFAFLSALGQWAWTFSTQRWSG